MLFVRKFYYYINRAKKGDTNLLQQTSQTIAFSPASFSGSTNHNKLTTTGPRRLGKHYQNGLTGRSTGVTYRPGPELLLLLLIRIQKWFNYNNEHSYCHCANSTTRLHKFQSFHQTSNELWHFHKYLQKASATNITLFVSPVISRIIKTKIFFIFQHFNIYHMKTNF